MLGQRLGEMGVQRVFLTATLSPDDEEELFAVAHISLDRVRFVRGKTVRRYSVFQVQAEDTDKEVACQVQRVLGSHPDDKVIVYCGRIADVERLAEAYGWDRFYSKVDSNQAKDRRLKQWIKTGQVMVATNALGVGLDVANIRAVIHHVAPRRLRESGRAGRDGQEAEAIVVREACGTGGRQGKRSRGEDADGHGAVLVG